MMTNCKVVDAWALLAWVRDEGSAAMRVRDCLLGAAEGDFQLLMSWINAGEVYYMLARKHNAKAANDFLRRLPSLPIRLMLPDEEMIMEAAKLKSLHRLSYADAFAVALAVREDAAVITGDPEIRDLSISTSGRVKVEWIGAA
jgi:predicted nucleic acid-binding protein